MKLKVTKFNENLLHVRNGEVVLYKREDSTNWQARYKLKDLKWHRVATKQKNLQYAAEVACEASTEHVFYLQKTFQLVASVLMLPLT